MKLRYVLFSLVLVALLFSAGGQAYAMTPEQQAAYNAWYEARFGKPPATQPETPQPTPETPAPTPSAPKKGSIQPVQPNAFETQMVAILNAERARLGLKPVTLDPQLVAVARVKAEDMIKNNYYGHGSSYGYSGSMLNYFGISVRLSRENICQASTPQMAHNIFMGSKSHKENMLKPYWDEVGIGVVKKPGSSLYYVVEIFVQR